MDDLQKFNDLHRALHRSGRREVQMMLCKDSDWCDYHVTALWVEDGDDRIHYSTPRFSDCVLNFFCDEHVRNAAYLFDQLFTDRNLF